MFEITKMNKLSIIFTLFVLFYCSAQFRTEQITSLDLKINRTEYLVGDLIYLDVIISNPPIDQSITVSVKGKSNKPIESIIECIECSTRVLVGDELLVQSSDKRIQISNNQSTDKPSTQISDQLNDLNKKLLIASHQLIKRESIVDNKHVLSYRWKAIEASKLTLFIETNLTETFDKKTTFVEIGIIKSRNLSVIADIVGWSYFVFWMICFYPQVYMNWKNRSCVGLSMDYCILNFVGFLFYAVFNYSIYFVHAVQAEYSKVYPYSNIPVLTNDLVFSIHHLIISAIIAIQCIFLYENGGQKFSRSCIVSLTTIFSGFILLGYYVLDDKFNLLDYVYFCGFVKMFFTALKYVPQAYSNYQKKSTLGWSVSFNIYDMLGGLSCLLQMFILIHNYQDWSFITKNIAKTGIALLTLVFDVVFLVQHFCLYGNKTQLNQNKLNGYGATTRSSSKQGDSNLVLFKKETNNNSMV